MPIFKNALSFCGHNPADLPVTAVLETSGPSPVRDTLLALCLVGQQESFCYLDLRPDAKEREVAVGLLKSYPLVFFNAARCSAWLAQLTLRPKVEADPLLLAYVLDPTQPLGLDDLTRQYLGKPAPEALALTRFDPPPLTKSDPPLTLLTDTEPGLLTETDPPTCRTILCC